MSRFFGQKGHEIIWFCLGQPHLSYFVNSVLAGLCHYDNQTFSANQSITTSNCRERCQCHHINGTAITKCKPLCLIEDDPKCHPHSERLTEIQRSVDDTNCTCTKKRCLSGKELRYIRFRYQFTSSLSIISHISKSRSNK